MAGGAPACALRRRPVVDRRRRGRTAETRGALASAGRRGDYGRPVWRRWLLVALFFGAAHDGVVGGPAGCCGLPDCAPADDRHIGGALLSAPLRGAPGAGWDWCWCVGVGVCVGCFRLLTVYVPGAWQRRSRG